MITLIWAMDVNRVIGFQNKLPWHYKIDMAYFKQHAYHQDVLMGYQTYISMLEYFPSKKLPFKHIYIATRSERHIENADIINDLDAFLISRTKDLVVIGGAQIYQQAFSYADALHITYVLKTHQGDTFFPEYSLKDFKLKSYQTESELILSYYERIKL